MKRFISDIQSETGSLKAQIKVYLRKVRKEIAVRAEHLAQGSAVVPGGQACRALSVLYFLARGPKVSMGPRRVYGVPCPQY
ncbi:hypothetical protein NDU88_002108 [Pleurodeles waltl]|uniref:Uncharacterized protein n=1 Tax=Pleurodeles waltl TaxID=8319 RepID=A0AAV7UUM8_PLEWA|nr:hypothetical protein NDU88_002108 [Pleurodeles waltl]